MEAYSIEKVLKLEKRVGITKEVYNILRERKRKLKKNGEEVSMAKMVCNLIIKNYGK